jgi:hypothetical protein
VNNLPFDIGESEIPAGVSVGEFLVIDSHEVENGGMEVVKVNGFVFSVVAVVVSRSVNRARFDPATGHEHGKTVRVVIATVISLSGGGTSEFAAPEDEGFIEEAPLF